MRMSKDPRDCAFRVRPYGPPTIFRRGEICCGRGLVHRTAVAATDEAFNTLQHQARSLLTAIEAAGAVDGDQHDEVPA